MVNRTHQDNETTSRTDQGGRDSRLRAAWEAIQTVTDPEIPVLSVVDMGIIANIRLEERRLIVDVTPTFVGCPAVDLIRANIVAALASIGEKEAEVNLVFDPPWTSDRISEVGRKKLKEVGFSPPVKSLVQIGLATPKVPCPFCDSNHTTMESMFGPTLCRSIYYWNACRQSFEHFKTV